MVQYSEHHYTALSLCVVCEYGTAYTKCDMPQEWQTAILGVMISEPTDKSAMPLHMQKFIKITCIRALQHTIQNTSEKET